MGQPWVTGTEVHSRYIQTAEAGHVRPTELGSDVAARGFHERCSCGAVEAWQRTRGSIVDLHCETLGGIVRGAHAKHVKSVLQCFLHAAVRSEAEVHEGPGFIGNRVRCHAGLGHDNIEPLAISQSIDIYRQWRIVRDPDHDSG